MKKEMKNVKSEARIVIDNASLSHDLGALANRYKVIIIMSRKMKYLTSIQITNRISRVIAIIVFVNGFSL